MGKVVAILEEPSSCMYCELGAAYICGVMHNHMTDNRPYSEYAKYRISDYVRNHTKPDWCPLKKLSEVGLGDDQL